MGERPHKLLRVIADTIIREHLAEPTQPILVATSGGADSVALLVALSLLGYKVSAVHCNFSLRAEESDGDEAYVRELSEQLKIPFYTKRFDTYSYAREHKLSIEMAARELRYSYFAELRGALGLEHRLAIAHHREDQIETVLMNIFSGTGLRGLKGMAYLRDGYIIRPMLDATREEILDFLKERALSYREDSTNREVIYQRNYIRHEIIPRLRRLNPSLEETLQRSIEIHRMEYALYAERLSSLRDKVLAKDRLDIKQLQREEPLTTPLLYALLESYGFSYQQCRQMLHEEQRLGRRFHSATHLLITGACYWELIPLEETESWSVAADLSEGEHSLASGLDYKVRLLSPEESLEDWKAPHTIVLDVEKVAGKKIVWRTIRAGDSFAPIGMQGKKKKLVRYMRDIRASHRERLSAVVLATEEGEILWLVGYRAAEGFIAKASTKKRLLIALNH